MKKVTTYIGILCLLISTSLLAQDEFITTWTTNSTITLPASDTNYIYNYDVDWENDGIYDDFGVTGVITHDYGVAGTYTVAIKGDFPKIDFSSSSDRDKIISIDQWGTQKWMSMNYSFRGCRNMIITATDSPDLSLVTDMSYMFRGAESLNQDLSSWDVSNVTNMSYMFKYAINFNQPIGSWNVSKVTNMKGMFEQTLRFNQNIDSWDVSNVINMESMFDQAYFFDKPIGSWDVSGVTNMYRMFWGAANFNQSINDWNVSKITNMNRMFYACDIFNQPLGSWDVSNVTNMTYMFGYARMFNQPIDAWNVSKVNTMSLMFFHASSFNQVLKNWDVSNLVSMQRMFDNATDFNQDLGNWNVQNVTGMTSIFNGVTLSTNNYDSLLTNWSKLPLKSNISFYCANSTYCNSANERQSIIDNFGWTIVDSGLDCSNLSTSDFDNLNIMLFPNPITSSFTISGIEKTIYNVQILNLQGQIVKELMHYDLEPISINSLTNGVYFVKINANNASKTIKVIKVN